MGLSKKTLLILPALILIAGFVWKISVRTPMEYIQPASVADSIARYKLDPQKARVIIRKSGYKLELYIDKKLVKTYPVVFGPDPVNDKMQQGDGCTPEGIYKLRAKYPHRSWTYFLWIDYPNEAAWKRFNENKKKGLIAKNAKIGGEIGIHGVPFVSSKFGERQSDTAAHAEYMVDQKTNWTAGCISLKTQDIAEIYRYMPVGTEIEIIH